jgi:hypothetical protein
VIGVWSVAQLFEDVTAAQPHYIRCIAPNRRKAAAVFDNTKVRSEEACWLSEMFTLFLQLNRNLCPFLSLPPFLSPSLSLPLFFPLTVLFSPSQCPFLPLSPSLSLSLFLSLPLYPSLPLSPSLPLPLSPSLSLSQVLEQLRSCGVVETVRISAAGMPTRIPYAEFRDRYAVLCPVSKEVFCCDLQFFYLVSIVRRHLHKHTNMLTLCFDVASL